MPRLKMLKIAFNRVRMYVAAHVFIGLVRNAFMARKMITEREIVAAFIGHHCGFFRDVRFDDWNKFGRANAVNMERTNLLALTVN
jgi:hypothetical protein